MNDEHLYLQATNEVEGGSQKESLWAKVMALSEGDEAIAKYKYINLRVEQLIIEQKNKIEHLKEEKVSSIAKLDTPIQDYSVDIALSTEKKY